MREIRAIGAAQDTRRASKKGNENVECKKNA